MHAGIVIGLLCVIVALLGVIAYLCDRLTTLRRENEQLLWERLHGPVACWAAAMSTPKEPAPRG